MKAMAVAKTAMGEDESNGNSNEGEGGIAMATVKRMAGKQQRRQ